MILEDNGEIMLSLLAIAASLSIRPPGVPDEARLLDQARTQLEQTLAAYPSDRQAHLLLGRVDARSGRDLDAMAQFQLAARDGSLKASLAADPLQEAYALQHQHHWPQAAKAFRAAVAEAPSATTYAALANYLDLTGSYADGLAVATKGRDLFPDDPEVAVADAECLGDTDHYHAAMALCERELTRYRASGASDKIRARFRLILAGAQGDAAEKDGILAMLKYAFSVKKNIDKAIALDPTYARAFYGAGMYAAEAPIGADLNRGIMLLEKAHRLDPDDYGIQQDLISKLLQAGRKTEASSELAQFDEAFAGLPAARRDIASIARKLQ